MAGRNPKFNDSGCKDMTAYEAMKNITREEHELNQRVHEVIKILKCIIEWAGFDLIARIEIRDKKTRKEFR